MTGAAYLEAPYEREFEASVDRILGDRLVLSQTLFYPTGGGQPHDTGTIRVDDRSYRVVDVTQRDRIYHSLEPVDSAQGGESGTIEADEDLDVGRSVVGRLDWERRYAHMRYHTAQHLLSALLLEDFGAMTTGNQLYADRARIDCEYDRFESADLARIETRMNDLVDAGLPVSWRTLPREEAEASLDPNRTRLDLLPERITDVRIVEIDDFDRTACAGTHVANTEEIGTVSINGRETQGPEGERIRFALGD